MCIETRSTVLALFVLALLCQSVVASAEERMFIDPHSVESIKIVKRGTDAARQLPQSEAIVFATAWNEAKAIGLCKYAFEYRISLHLKNGRKIEYRTNGQTIKAENDYCFSVREAGTFKKLWDSSENR